MTDKIMDAGPLIAVVNRNDDDHAACADLLRRLNCAYYTTLPVLTEAMHVVYARGGGLPAQQAIWTMVLRGDLILWHPEPDDLVRMAFLMTQYADLPMDFADASLVVLAERLALSEIVTLDRRDFSVYRIQGRDAFTLLPSA